MPLRLAIGCSNYLYSEGLKKLLEDESHINIIGIFNGGSGSLPDLIEIEKHDPDVILADFNADFNILIGLPDDYFAGNRLKILLIGDRSLRFIVDRHLKGLISRGVVGILPQSADSDLLKRAIKAVSLGELWLDRTTMMKMLLSIRRQERYRGLAEREREIMSLICKGFRNKEISQKLNISEQTVKSHCNRIYKKVGVSDRLQLAVYANKIWPNNLKI